MARPSSAQGILPESHEYLIEAFSTHWVKYLGPCAIWMLLLGGSMLLFLFGGLSAHHVAWLSHLTFFFAVLLLLLAHHWFFHRILSEGMVDIIITNKRLILLEDRIWFCDDMHEVSLAQIRAVEARKHGFFENLLHYGTLWFDTGGSSVQSGKMIPRVPHPQRKARIITELLGMK